MPRPAPQWQPEPPGHARRRQRSGGATGSGRPFPALFSRVCRPQRVSTEPPPVLATLSRKACLIGVSMRCGRRIDRGTRCLPSSLRSCQVRVSSGTFIERFGEKDLPLRPRRLSRTCVLQRFPVGRRLALGWALLLFPPLASRAGSSRDSSAAPALTFRASFSIAHRDQLAIRSSLP